MVHCSASFLYFHMPVCYWDTQLALSWQRLQQESCRQNTAQHYAACWHVGATNKMQPGAPAESACSCWASAVQLLNRYNRRQEHDGHSAVQQDTGDRVMKWRLNHERCGRRHASSTGRQLWLAAVCTCGYQQRTLAGCSGASLTVQLSDVSLVMHSVMDLQARDASARLKLGMHGQPVFHMRYELWQMRC